MGTNKVLYRLPKQGKIAGVCAGLAEYFDIDVTLVRLIFVAFVIISAGTAIFLYVIMAIILPENREQIGDTFGEKASRLGREFKSSNAINWARNYFGIGLVVFGAWLLLEQLFPDLINLKWALIWPIALIVVGVAIIFRKVK